MAMTRRAFALAAGASILATVRAGQPSVRRKDVAIVLAPTNLGLRPEDGAQPGTWRAPQSLLDAGLAGSLGVADIVRLGRPAYDFSAQAGTRIRNGLSIRDFSLALANRVHTILAEDQFPVVIGGDCSVLLGGLYGLRLAGGRGLVHVDGHSDFFHPGNYDTASRLGSVAGMDLALASGRGETLLTEWPQVTAPLAADKDIVQVGQRDADDEHEDHIPDTAIAQLTVQRVHSVGIQAAASSVIEMLKARNLTKVWLHVDFDVLDQLVMPAVDSPGSPGLNFEELSALINAWCASGYIAGVDFAIYDPARDPAARYAKPLVQCIAQGIRGLAQVHS